MLRRIGETALKVLGVFVILEPIWMLLPFAGFLYGSVFRIQTLSQNPDTAWLTHFVFPVLTLGWLGPALVLAGLGIFVVGAVQVYTAKLRRTGLVTGGLYRFVRHPQYTALTFFALGLLLAWGRAVAYVAYFAMLFLYYCLARIEERRCVELFGDEYRRYRERTSFVIPGDRALRGLVSRLPGSGLPAYARILLAFVLTMAVCFASMRLVDTVKRAVRSVPHLVETVELASSAQTHGIRAAVAGGVPFVTDGYVAVVRGPYRNAAAPGFAERVLLGLRRTQALDEALFVSGREVVVVFGIPFHPPETPRRPGRPPDDDPDRRGPPRDPAGPDRVRLVILKCRLAPGAEIADAFEDRSTREILKAWIVPVNVGRP
ncbi:MAG: methyltransferase family protein, partial [Planctomycetota bacterium]